MECICKNVKFAMPYVFLSFAEGKFISRTSFFLICILHLLIFLRVILEHHIIFVISWRKVYGRAVRTSGLRGVVQNHASNDVFSNTCSTTRPCRLKHVPKSCKLRVRLLQLQNHVWKTPQNKRLILHKMSHMSRYIFFPEKWLII